MADDAFSFLVAWEFMSLSSWALVLANHRAAENLRKGFGGEVWDKGFRFTLTYMEGRADRALACQILKRNIEALNPKFRVDVRPVQWSTWLSDWSARNRW